MGNCEEGTLSLDLDGSYPYSRGPEARDRPGVPMDFKCLKRRSDGVCVDFDPNKGPSYFRVKFLTEMQFEM